MKQKYYFLSAVAASMLMLSACSNDDGNTDAVDPDLGTPLVVSANTGEITTAFTRAEASVQGAQFQQGETIDVFLRDASDPASVSDTTAYHTQYGKNPFKYKTTNASGALQTYQSDGVTPNRIYWPKLMHPLYIFGVYPEGSLSWTNRKTEIAEASYNPFDYAQDYYFTVQQDQTGETAYKSSDLMTGLPSTYAVHAASFTAPFKLTQNENPGTIPLTFTHRLTKIIVNVFKTTGTTLINMDDIRYSSGTDTKYARVTLLNTLRKTWFKLYNTGTYDVVATDRVSSVSPDTIAVGRGNTPTSGPNISLAAVVPPQVIAADKDFIKVVLIDEVNGNANDERGPKVVDLFLYRLPSALTLEASKVYTFNIRINKPDIVVTTTITDWTGTDATDAIGKLQ